MEYKAFWAKIKEKSVLNTIDELYLSGKMSSDQHETAVNNMVFFCNVLYIDNHKSQNGVFIYNPNTKETARYLIYYVAGNECRVKINEFSLKEFAILELENEVLTLKKLLNQRKRVNESISKFMERKRNRKNVANI